MDQMEIITLIIALCSVGISLVSLGISAYLGYLKRKEYQRRIHVTLEYVHFFQFFRVVIVNIGHRPITITSISARCGKHLEEVPFDALLASIEDVNKLPVKLEDGDQVEFHLGEVVSCKGREEGIEITVHDAEGKSYKADRVLHYNPKYGKYSPPPKNE